MYVYMELQDYPWYHIIGQDGSAISALLRDTTGIYDAIFFMLWRQNEATFWVPNECEKTNHFQSQTSDCWCV